MHFWHFGDDGKGQNWHVVGLQVVSLSHSPLSGIISKPQGKK